MGKIKPPEQSLLFVGTLYSDEKIADSSKELLKKTFGDILFESMPMPWDYSSYYDEELGRPIFRQFLFFKNFIDPGTLADIKLGTNELEENFSSNGKRKINLDPGYLTLSKIVLASTKDYAHRIYLGKGIYAELTLIFKNGAYAPCINTYRDYQDKKYIDIFMTARAMLKNMTASNQH
jgi:hypothetical protein